MSAMFYYTVTHTTSITINNLEDMTPSQASQHALLRPCTPGYNGSGYKEIQILWPKINVIACHRAA